MGYAKEICGYVALHSATSIHPTSLAHAIGKGLDSKISASSGQEKDGQTKQTYQRYYHLYRQGELEKDVSDAGGIVCESGYEKDNWYAIVQTKVQG